MIQENLIPGFPLLIKMLLLDYKLLNNQEIIKGNIKTYVDQRLNDFRTTLLISLSSFFFVEIIEIKYAPMKHIFSAKSATTFFLQITSPL